MLPSLHEHLTSEAHDELAFHPGCPLCREQRLLGRLPLGPLVGRRAQAGLLAASLAASSLAVPATVLADPPSQIPGGHGDQAEEPESIDDGGDDTDADSDQDPAGGNLITPDREAPADQEPDTDPAAEPPPAAPEPAPPAATPAPVAPPAVPAPPAVVPKERFEQTDQRETQKDDSSARAKPAPATPRPLPAALTPPTPSPPPAAPLANTPAPASPPAPAGGQGEVRVVRAGESLWLIAQTELGAGAGAGAAEIAQLVERIWQLNASAIGTGTPDLIHPGQRLRMP